MSKKYKVTGCARLFIILIILAPLTYIGASYINGENGIENFKRLIRFEKIFGGENSSTDTMDPADSPEVRRLQNQVDKLEEENKELKDQVEYLQEKLDRLNQQEE